MKGGGLVHQPSLSAPPCPPFPLPPLFPSPSPSFSPALSLSKIFLAWLPDRPSLPSGCHEDSGPIEIEGVSHTPSPVSLWFLICFRFSWFCPPLPLCRSVFWPVPVFLVFPYFLPPFAGVLFLFWGFHF